MRRKSTEVTGDDVQTEEGAVGRLGPERRGERVTRKRKRKRRNDPRCRTPDQVKTEVDVGRPVKCRESTGSTTSPVTHTDLGTERMFRLSNE